MYIENENILGYDLHKSLAAVESEMLAPYLTDFCDCNGYIIAQKVDPSYLSLHVLYVIGVYDDDSSNDQYFILDVEWTYFNARADWDFTLHGRYNRTKEE